jgi:gliding motility-associated-like protein
MVLYESTNIVEVHTQSKPICATWNSGRATTGIENPTPGAIWYTAPGQNGVAFTATNEAWRFTPTGIPTWTYTWYSSLSPLTPIGTGLTANVCPTVNTTYYVKGVATSNCDSIIVWDSVRVNAAPIISAQTKVDPSVCGKCDGSIKLFGIIAPGSTVSINYNFNSAPVTATAVVAPDSSVTLTGLCAGSYSQFFISSGQCGAPMTLINPPVAAAFTVTTMLGCNGDSVIISNGSTPPGYYSYWNYGDGVTDSSITNPLHIYTTAPSYTGTYTITLNYNTTNNHNPACNATATQVVNFNHPIASVFTRTPDTMCIGTPVVLSNASYGNGATYLWDFGNGITDTAFIPAPYTYPVSGVYSISLTVTDTIGCVQKSSATVFIISIDVATSFIDTNVCLLDSMSIHSSIRMPAEITSVNYSWLPPDNLGDPTSPTPKFFGVGDFVYSLVATTPAPYFCADTAVATIHSYPPITLFNLTPSPQTIPLGGSIQLNANGAVYYTWAPNNGTLNNNNINNPIATPVDSVTIYTVYGMNAYGCPDTAEIIVYVDVDSHEFIPTGFTPNGDGKNDIFRLVRLKYQKLVDFSVFNRWGERVFQTANIEEGWDGKFNGVPQDMGVYFYVATVAKPDGTQKVYKGDVTLIR